MHSVDLTYLNAVVACVVLYYMALYVHLQIKRLRTSAPVDDGYRPFVFIIIPAHNEEDVIGHTVESLLHQDYPHRAIMVMNDGSKDRTSEIAHSYAAQHDEVVVVDRGPDIAGRGKGAVLNHAYEMICSLVESGDCPARRPYCRRRHHRDHRCRRTARAAHSDVGLPPVCGVHRWWRADRRANREQLHQHPDALAGRRVRRLLGVRAGGTRLVRLCRPWRQRAVHTALRASVARLRAVDGLSDRGPRPGPVTRGARLAHTVLPECVRGAASGDDVATAVPPADTVDPGSLPVLEPPA